MRKIEFFGKKFNNIDEICAYYGADPETFVKNMPSPDDARIALLCSTPRYQKLQVMGGIDIKAAPSENAPNLAQQFVVDDVQCPNIAAATHVLLDKLGMTDPYANRYIEAAQVSTLVWLHPCGDGNYAVYNLAARYCPPTRTSNRSARSHR